MKISRKCLKRIALERSQIARNDYILDIAKFSSDILVYLDESTTNEHTI